MTCTCMCHVPHAHAMWSHSRVGRALLSPHDTQNAPGRAPQHAADTTRGATHTQKVDKNNDQQSASCLERLAQTHNLFLVLSDVLRQEALHFGELLLRRHRPSLELRALAL